MKRLATSRRQFLAAGLANTVTYSLLSRTTVADGVADQYRGLKTDKYLGAVKVLSEIKDKKVFTEGPAAHPDGRLFLTNVPANKILVWDESKKALTVFRENSNAANGLFFDSKARLLACEGAKGRVTRTTLDSGRIEVLASEYNGFPFAAPNDLVVDQKGRVYFTSRPGGTDPKKGNVNSVYRIDPGGHVTQLLAWPRVHMPNGIVISPSQNTLYVIEAHPDADRHRDIRRYALKADGSLGKEATHINFYPGRSGDGMCIDTAGNLYVAAGLHKTRKTSETLDTRPGIHVVSQKGKLLACRATPLDTITNCTFGGKDRKTLYVTCGKYLVSMRTEIPGLKV